MTSIRLLLFLLLLCTNHLYAKITLPSVISDGMVLQQRADVALWGKANNNARIIITTSWNDKTYTTKATASGDWRLLVKTVGAGGPFTISLSDGEKITLKNILLGEVWLCSGQSNMDMPVKGFTNQPILYAGELMMDADNDQVRLFRMEVTGSRVPNFDGAATPWLAANGETIKDFSAVGYQYAKLLQQRLKVPVGIIQAAVGGTKIEFWMSASSLSPFSDVKIKSPDDPSKVSGWEPTALFNAMINPIAGYHIKGAIWYQGESNSRTYQNYEQLMQTMVSDWRKRWNCGEWPFYFVQIAPHFYRDSTNKAAFLREKQQKAMNSIANAGMVVTMDVGEELRIHPSNKTTISNRLVAWALGNTYGYKGIPFASPTYQSSKIVKSAIEITFNNTSMGLMASHPPLSAFEIAGDDRKFYPADAIITKTGVTVRSAQVKDPVAVRYAFKDWVVGDLFSLEGLPVAPFRTDDWPTP
ncbi:sialate O-acetylesterase [Paraflavitalea sp. CAU 1676]|uniref:sialate O-acetylesterase n=1 Tax=Paraflavitalea sp. CAU 1676 TaxID=3032598 RepID=UPI0023DA02D0|nr:sialate O-acetylesterase [Paraflavitalea sp. CAU 1676]MDF2193493.1 sialate O-acetylesterase [Paraflavitalea sp. CAU 1676]